ncbi:MAG TPA: phosphopantetheine-binding protein [Xanthobacteraceae bacterium]|jgi:acyl carrier protein
MSAQETNPGYDHAHRSTDAPDRVLAIVHEVFARRSAFPSRPILPNDDLRDVGLSSLDMVNLMLAVEADFEIKVPDTEMTLTNFRSIASINALIASVLENG